MIEGPRAGHRPSGPPQELFLTAARGTEAALKAELRELGLRGAKEDRGGVRLKGGRGTVFRACLRSRIAVRVLLRVATFACGDEDALYEAVRAVAWERWLAPERTLGGSAVSRDSRLRHTGYLAQRVKDAVVDRQRARGGRRSSVDRRDPDVAVFLRLKDDRAQLFLDASGGSLHRRGWRRRGGPAPLKETLAAACLRLSGWSGRSPLLDPMCGSGTLAIEADLWARGVPAQAPDRRFGFERWLDFDVGARRELGAARAEAEGGARAKGPPCRGADRDPAAVARAVAHAAAAGSRATFAECRLADATPPAPRGLLIANPPYGKRLDPGPAFRTELRRALARFAAWDVALLVPREGKGWYVRGRPARRHALFNGPLECELLVWSPAA
ncbi:MAG: class I SAM-dependent RNA methyltransferase [Sandaracinaceae bacterium]